MQNSALRLKAIAGTASNFNPLNLFTSGEQGAWYDPSDLTTLFQDSAGTIPVTAVEQPVGLMKDKSGKSNHAFQATAGNRPMLSARVNLLTKTESIATSPWSIRAGGTIVATDNYAIAPNGTMTATLLNKTSTVIAQWQQAFTSVVGTTYTGAIFIQKTLTNNVVELAARAAYSTTSCEIYGNIDTKTGLTYKRFGEGTISAKSVGDYWAFSVLPTNVSAGILADAVITIIPSVGTILGTPDFTATGSCVVWGADLRPTNSGALLPPYQRVNTASDYDTVGFPLYLKANGTSSAMSTNSVDFTGTDKMTVVTGVRKLNDRYDSIIELSATLSNAGSFQIANNTTNAYGYALNGSVVAAYAPTTYIPPISNVLAGLFDISGALIVNEITPRINGIVNQTNSVASPSAGTGNFGNYPLYLFARAGTSLFLNGQFYGAIIRGAQSDTASVTQTEQYMAQKTGITF